MGDEGGDRNSLNKRGVLPSGDFYPMLKEHLLSSSCVPSRELNSGPPVGDTLHQFDSADLAASERSWLPETSPGTLERGHPC